MKRRTAIYLTIGAFTALMICACEKSSGNTTQNSTEPETTSFSEAETTTETETLTTTADPDTTTAVTTKITSNSAMTSTTAVTKFSEKELFQCQKILMENAEGDYSLLEISYRKNCVVVTCPDAESEARIKSRLPELGIDPEMILFGPYSKGPVPM